MKCKPRGSRSCAGGRRRSAKFAAICSLVLLVPCSLPHVPNPPFSRPHPLAYTHFQNVRLSSKRRIRGSRAIVGLSRTAWRPRPPAICMWGTLAPSGPPFSARARQAVRSSCAWRIWTPTAAAPSTQMPHSTISAGWESAGRRGRIWEAPTRVGRSPPMCRASAAPSILTPGASCCALAACSRAVARARTWRPRSARRMKERNPPPASSTAMTPNPTTSRSIPAPAGFLWAARRSFLVPLQASSKTRLARTGVSAFPTER